MKRILKKIKIKSLVNIGGINSLWLPRGRKRQLKGRRQYLGIKWLVRNLRN